MKKGKLLETFVFFVSKKKKRGQQSSFGMSFNMLFSIFLIITFVALAFIVIKVFLNFGQGITVGQFYDDLQDEVDSAWRSSETVKEFKFELSKDVTHVCFANLSSPVTGNKEFYDLIQNYAYYGYNTFIIPPGAADGLEAKKTNNIDIDKITAMNNPYCVPNPGSMTISKGIRTRLVSIS